jgi:hypothetical protein
MDGYSGIQFGQQQGYVGKVNYSGNTNSSQGVDVTSLQAGDTFKGEIASVNGEDVQILLTNGQYMSARLERDVQVALGQILNLQVQSNKDNKIVLKPLYDNNAQLVRVGEAALRAANIAVNAKNLNLVSNLLQNGMSIDKNTLSTYNRLSLQNPDVDVSTLIGLNKLKVPVTEGNVNQLQNYENMQHKILDGVNETADEVINLFDTISKDGKVTEGTRFMEQVVELLGEEDSAEGAVATKEGQGSLGNVEAGMSETDMSETDMSESDIVKADIANKDMARTIILETDTPKTDMPKNDTSETSIANKETVNKEIVNSDTINKDANTEVQKSQTSNIDEKNISVKDDLSQKSAQNKAITNELEKSDSAEIPLKVVKYINDGKLDIKDVKQLLNNSNIAAKLTDEQKSEIFKSEPFKSLVKTSFQNRWTLTPEEISKDGKVEEFYEKLAKETSKLSKVIEDTIAQSGQDASVIQAKSAANINDNIEFMNQLNHMMNYVQLPLKLSDSNAHGDLYVYTNKKNLARNDGTLTAFLHLDMDNLGSLDVSIAMQTDKNRVTTKFYLDEDSLALVDEHKDELIERLSKKGYQCNAIILEKDEDKTVMDHLEEQVSGQNAMIGYRTFDTRA